MKLFYATVVMNPDLPNTDPKSFLGTVCTQSSSLDEVQRQVIQAVKEAGLTGNFSCWGEDIGETNVRDLPCNVLLSEDDLKKYGFPGFKYD